MKIYDISQELFSCVVWPGDPSPVKQTLNSMSDGDLYNLTAFSMCTHNGTHIDAPSHFIIDGKNVDQIDLERFVGEAFVAEANGVLTAEDALRIIDKAKSASYSSGKRILLKGKTTVSFDAAKAFAENGVYLIGNESQTVGPEDGPMAVHKVLLGAEIVLLEGIRLEHIPEGVYLLNAAPINLAGAEGAPCRAILVDLP